MVARYVLLVAFAAFTASTIVPAAPIPAAIIAGTWAAFILPAYLFKKES